MKVGIVWLPNVGKSTLFNILMNAYCAQVGNFPFCTIEPNVGKVVVEDERLSQIATVACSQNIVHATCEFVDIAWIVKGASQGAGLWNKFLAHIREVDVIFQVIRFFENPDVIRVEWVASPKDEKDIVEMELILADIEMLEKRIQSISKKTKTDELAKKKYDVYVHILTGLNQWIPARKVITEEMNVLLDDLPLLTKKKYMYVANIDESMLSFSKEEFGEILWVPASDIVPVCIALEKDMLGMTEEERSNFLEEFHVPFRVTDLIALAYSSLGLQSYFTAWEKEARAWSIKQGATALEAAGKIHSDFEKWFIKAEVVYWKDFIALWGWNGARNAWKVRIEWKEYMVEDGDVMFFKVRS